MQIIPTIYPGFTIRVPFTPRAGQIIRYSATGGFLRVEDQASNGLGISYRMRADGRAERFIY